MCHPVFTVSESKQNEVACLPKLVDFLLKVVALHSGSNQERKCCRNRNAMVFSSMAIDLWFELRYIQRQRPAQFAGSEAARQPNIFNNLPRPNFWAPSLARSVRTAAGRVKREPDNLEKYHSPCRPPPPRPRPFCPGGRKVVGLLHSRRSDARRELGVDVLVQCRKTG